MNPRRAHTIQTVQLISDFDAQRGYEEDVPIADVPAELVCQWFDDFYHPEVDFYRAAFSDQELQVLAVFNAFFDKRVALLPRLLAEMHQSQSWREVALKAKWVLATLHWKEIEAIPDGS